MYIITKLRFVVIFVFLCSCQFKSDPQKKYEWPEGEIRSFSNIMEFRSYLDNYTSERPLPFYDGITGTGQCYLCPFFNYDGLKSGALATDLGKYYVEHEEKLFVISSNILSIFNLNKGRIVSEFKRKIILDQIQDDVFHVNYGKILIKGGDIFVFGTRNRYIKNSRSLTEIQRYKIVEDDLLLLDIKYIDASLSYDSIIVGGNGIQGLFAVRGELNEEDTAFLLPNAVPHVWRTETGGQFKKIAPLLPIAKIHTPIVPPRWPAMYYIFHIEDNDSEDIALETTAFIGEHEGQTFVTNTHFLFSSTGYLYAVDRESFDITAHPIPFEPASNNAISQNGGVLAIHSQEKGGENSSVLVEISLEDFDKLGSAEYSFVSLDHSEQYSLFDTINLQTKNHFVIYRFSRDKYETRQPGGAEYIDVYDRGSLERISEIEQENYLYDMQKLDDKRVVLFFSNEVEEGSYKLNSYIKILDLESMELGDALSVPDFKFGPYDSSGVFVDCVQKSGRCIFGVSIRASSGNEGGMDRYNLAFYGVSGIEVHDFGFLKSGQLEACGGFCQDGLGGKEGLFNIGSTTYVLLGRTLGSLSFSDVGFELDVAVWQL